jgi:hypothetical protein
MSSILTDRYCPIYEPKCGGRGWGVAGSQSMSTAVHRSLNKDSIFNLKFHSYSTLYNKLQKFLSVFILVNHEIKHVRIQCLIGE